MLVSDVAATCGGCILHIGTSCFVLLQGYWCIMLVNMAEQQIGSAVLGEGVHAVECGFEPRRVQGNCD